jgi:hypothetical protein
MPRSIDATIHRTEPTATARMQHMGLRVYQLGATSELLLSQQSYGIELDLMQCRMLRALLGEHIEIHSKSGGPACAFEKG